jgi:hypothetical protein
MVVSTRSVWYKEYGVFGVRPAAVVLNGFEG